MRYQCPVVQFVESGKLIHPTHVFHTILISSNHNPNTGQPMRNENEESHQKAQNYSTILREPKEEEVRTFYFLNIHNGEMVS